MTNIVWSKEQPFTRQEVESVPEKPGVYELLQSDSYPRYHGQTRTVKFGCSEKSLRDELGNHFNNHTTANRIKRIQKNCSVTFRYYVTNITEWSKCEKELLRTFEDKHFDLPVCNSTRGYSRGEDKHYRL